MEQILTSPKAREIIDWVSPIYGESVIGLHLFQAIGTALDTACDIAEQLRDEVQPISAGRLLDLWEEHFGLIRDPALTQEQRRARLLSKQLMKAPSNPKKLEWALSQILCGADVHIAECTAKNTFAVFVSNPPEQALKELPAALDLLFRRKPAHLLTSFTYRFPTLHISEVPGALLFRHLFLLLRIHNMEDVFLNGLYPLNGTWVLLQALRGMTLPRLRLTAAFRSPAGSFTGLSLVLDSLWLLDGFRSLDGSRTLHAEIVTQTLQTN